MTSVYLHIPFCERICFYCDFPKKVGKKAEIVNYLTALRREVLMYQVKNPITTIYIGGGTPSILDEEGFVLLAQIIKEFAFSENCEFTVECNPEHINLERLDWFKSLGVNRISLGVQTFNDRLLKLLNRGHTKDSVFKAVELLKGQGFHNINIDLMFALPRQTISDVQDDLNTFLSLDVPHASYYSLILEEKTVFDKWVREGRINLCDNETEAAMYELILQTLTKNYHHYEISNFALPGFESRHNTVYWENRNYYGFGMGASGYLDNTRYYNEHLVKHYCDRVSRGELPVEHQDHLLPTEQLKEALLLGLRLIDGIKIDSLNARYQVDVLSFFKSELDELVKKEWIEITDTIKLTRKGLFYGNEVFAYFI